MNADCHAPSGRFSIVVVKIIKQIGQLCKFGVAPRRGVLASLTIYSRCKDMRLHLSYEYCVV
jgi:hypothetical protein